MSDSKHVQNHEPWNKTSPASAAAAARQPTYISTNAMTFPQIAAPNHADINFSAARFQAPSIHQQHANSSTHNMSISPTANFAHNHVTPSIASPNVPVYPVGGTTSILPSPFATVTGASTATTPVALQQLFHAMNSAMNTSPRAVTSLSPSLHTTVGNRAINAPDLPSPSSNSSAGVVATGGFHGSGGSGTVISSGAITTTITENVLNAISGLAQHSTPARNMGLGVKPAPDEEKLQRVHQMVAAGVSDNAKQQIVQILDCITTLKPVEKLLLYLRLPGAAPETDPLRQPQNPLGTRSEINHTINWVRSHLEQDPNVSIPKQDVYNDYIAYCERLDIKPLSTADFGKVMKQVFPGIRPRRLGTRGHSRYCYAAMRKTTKLSSPQLPQLGSGLSRGVEGTAEQSENSSVELNEQNSETWSVIKNWAESMLQVKLKDAKDLATLIKAGNLPSTAGNPSANASRINIAHKKFGNRETKEKRLMTDMGPLKKRRKKKRKGSSSSESSYSSQPPLKTNSNIKDPVQSIIKKSTSSLTAQNEPTAADNLNDLITEEETMKLIKVKEEFIESPNYQRMQHITPPNRHVASLGDNYTQQTQQQPQMLPINLAPEQRSVLSRVPSAVSAFNTSHTRPVTYGAAAKNLVPKIMELAATNAVSESVVQTDFQQALPSAIVPAIKEEDIDDYSTSNILCKKVRKAQQTKGVWQQTTSTVTTALTHSNINRAHIVPVITTNCATPTPILTPQDTQTGSSSTTANTPSPNYLMGPPAPASSTSPFANTDSAGHLTPTPKVASRNMMQLRAKRLQLAAAAAADANPTDELPENLGLPRERVISICNMDKHELDDYFINDEEEEENSNDQDTELLQYFQTGDAEEKLNSLDAGKQRNPTVAAVVTAASLVNNQQQNETTSSSVTLNVPLLQKEILTEKTAVTIVSSVSTNVDTLKNVLPTLTRTTMVATLPTTITTTKATVGSASASLAFMSQKHQQNLQQHHKQVQFQEQQTQISNIAATKRKIPPSGPIIKHYTFAPISPNISNSFLPSSSIANGVESAPVSGSNGVFFASPGLTPPTRLRPKPAFGKQQSLDIDLASSLSFPASAMSSMHDPMIGATRRRRNYTNVTSASAPPSPSILHQQQQQIFNSQHLQNVANQWQSFLTSSSTAATVNPSSSSFLNDQNSLDLDLFGATNGANHVNNNNTGNYNTGIDSTGGLTFDDYVSETQRSQSVPLSQLQRIHSPTAQNSVNKKGRHHHVEFGAENSLLGSENSCSQHSNSTVGNIIKLEDPTNTADAIVSDPTALLDGVDVSEILSSPDFVQNFTSIAQKQGNIIAATTTCSSAGSSSGYSSGACTTFSGSNNIMSRSVPSTPLPHHHQNLFGQSSINFYNQRRRSGLVNDELQLSPGSNGFINNSNVKSGTNTNFSSSGNNCTGSSFGNTFSSRSIYDISKSMPTTPITTPSFRYSPEFNRDFLINGNTIDDSISFGAVASDSLNVNNVTGIGTHDDESVNLVSNLNADDDVLIGNL